LKILLKREIISNFSNFDLEHTLVLRCLFLVDLQSTHYRENSEMVSKSADLERNLIWISQVIYLNLIPRALYKFTTEFLFLLLLFLTVIFMF